MAPKQFTQQEDDHIREWYGKRKVKDIAADLGRSESAVGRRARRIGVNFQREVIRIDGKGFVRWSDEEVEILCRLYPTHDRNELAVILNRHPDSVWHKAKRLRLKKRKLKQEGETYVWKAKGRAPRVMIKIGGKSYGYQRWLWEQHYGPVPEGMRVITKDRNQLNVTLDNLELISDRCMIYENNPKISPEEAVTYDLLAKIKDHFNLPRRRKHNGKKHTDRHEQPAV